jgi:hypothetical protein
MRTTEVKFVPRLLQNEQKQHRLEVFRELQQQLQEDPNFKKLQALLSLALPKMKIELKGRRCDMVEGIPPETLTVLNTLTQKGSQDVFKKWQKL